MTIEEIDNTIINYLKSRDRTIRVFGPKYIKKSVFGLEAQDQTWQTKAGNQSALGAIIGLDYVLNDESEEITQILTKMMIYVEQVKTRLKIVLWTIITLLFTVMMSEMIALIVLGKRKSDLEHGDPGNGPGKPGKPGEGQPIPIPVPVPDRPGGIIDQLKAMHVYIAMLAYLSGIITVILAETIIYYYKKWRMKKRVVKLKNKEEQMMNESTSFTSIFGIVFKVIIAYYLLALIIIGVVFAIAILIGRQKEVIDYGIYLLTGGLMNDKWNGVIANPPQIP
jgi:23S rRNA maturation mini-RNase III